jgi:hypothetical protein
MALNEYVNVETHQCLCLAHEEGPVWEHAKLRHLGFEDEKYGWQVMFDCGHVIELKVSVSELGSADNELLQIAETGMIDRLAAYIIEHEGE